MGRRQHDCSVDKARPKRVVTLFCFRKLPGTYSLYKRLLEFELHRANEVPRPESSELKTVISTVVIDEHCSVGGRFVSDCSQFTKAGISVHPALARKYGRNLVEIKPTNHYASRVLPISWVGSLDSRVVASRRETRESRPRQVACKEILR